MTRRERRQARHHRWGRVAALAAVALVAGGVAAGVVTSTPGRARAAPPRRPVLPPPTTVPVSLPASPTAAWVVAENAQPGTGGWALTKPSTQHEIEGFANAVSVDRDGSVQLFVSTTSATFVVEAYRMGWYGATGGRLVWTSPATPGAVQPGFTVTKVTNMVEDRWTPTLTVDTTGWPPGDYLFKLVAAAGWESYVPLTIRDDASTAALLINNSVTTWQAYNLYGGADLYEGAHGYASRSRIVSFDRPYALGTGSGDFLGNELHLVELVESQGLDVTYTTDVDVHEHPERLLAHRAFVSLGHDEYYSLAMRNALVRARDAGVNLAFLGANAIYRHIRFEPSPLGPDRHEIDYKNAREDPLRGKDDADVTPVAWESPPNNAPEDAIIGDQYRCNPVSADLVITDPAGWVFAGTGVTQDLHLAGVVGSEYDRYDPAPPSPRNITILAHSPVVCRKAHDFSDMTYYTAPSGAGVFATGTNLWIPLLNPSCPLPCSGAPLVQITENVLTAFASGPAAAAHPSTPNAPDEPATKVVGGD